MNSAVRADLLDHENLDVVDGMYVLHALGDNFANGLQAVNGTHGGDGVA
jgi:hypothetical protein